MAHVNKKSLIRQVEEALLEKLTPGRSKHQDKKDKTTRNRIYSYNTLQTYIKQACYFVKWCRDKYGCKTLKECREHVDEYLQESIDRKLSAYTIKLQAAAIAKVYGCSTVDFIKTPPRRRKDIKRSRGKCKRDRHFSEKNNAELVMFCRCTGLRRCEVTALTGDKLVVRDGKPYVYVTNGKGGKKRYVPIIDHADEIVALMQRAGSGKVFAKVPKAADIHSYRAEYATTFYNMNARKLDGLTHKQKYFCRRDRRGVVFDRQAMLIVSIALGHNRINVIAGHYLR